MIFVVPPDLVGVVPEKYLSKSGFLVTSTFTGVVPLLNVFCIVPWFAIFFALFTTDLVWIFWILVGFVTVVFLSKPLVPLNLFKPSLLFLKRSSCVSPNLGLFLPPSLRPFNNLLTDLGIFVEPLFPKSNLNWFALEINFWILFWLVYMLPF